jgi:hypothetical protein
MYPWFKYLHILGVFGFLIFHGVSINVAFALRRERNLERIRALIELSGRSIGFLYISLIILLLSGIVTGFMGKWWGQGWIWVSLGLLIGILVYMGFAGTGFYGQVRKAVGSPFMQGSKILPGIEPASPEEIDALLNRARPIQLAAVGFGALLVIAWLMMFKPF